MLRNYFLTAWRNLLKHKSFSFINIFGLAASLSVCLLAIMIIKDANNYDRFHPEAERTYRLLTDAIRKGGGEESYASSPHVVAEALTNDYTYVESWVPLARSLNGEFRAGGKLLPVDGLLTNPDFFQVFGFSLAEGNPATALAQPYSVVLTQETAERFFPGQNPVGQVLEHERLGNFTVTGVLAPFAGKTHLEFEALGSIATLAALEADREFPWLGNWNNYYSGYNFFRLREGVEPEQVAAALAQIVQTNYADLALESRDAGYRFRLQALSEITPGAMMSNNMGRAMPEALLWFLSVLCGIVLLSACFNYTNLTIARSLTRAKEVGVRKVMGANRRQVITQFMVETFTAVLLALLVAYGLLQLTIPAFSRLQLAVDSQIDLGTDLSTVGLFVGFALLTALIAGLLPALTLARYRPLVVLQRLENIKLFRRIGLRKALIVTQFAVSLIFLITLTIAWRQGQYAMQENFGADLTNVLNVDLQGVDYAQAVAEFGSLTQVQNVSATSHLMGTFRDSKVDVRAQAGDEPLGIRDYFIDHGFLPNMDLEVIAGENFPNNPAQQRELFAIVNEEFLRHFKLGEPGAAIGKSILVGDSTQLSIRGVVKDFLYKPLNYRLEPLLLRYVPDHLAVLNLTVNTSDVPATLAALERSWKRLDPLHPMQYSFYDEAVKETFASINEMLWVVGYFGMLGLLIACLGLLGIAIYSAQTKAREIGIRKIVGAGPWDLVVLLSRGFFLLLIIATVVALPVSFLLGKQVLQAFAYQIPLSPWLFLPGVGLLFLLGALTIGSQTVRAALANPVEAVRRE